MSTSLPPAEYLIRGASLLPINTTRTVSICRYARSDPFSPVELFFMCAISTRDGICVVWISCAGDPTIPEDVRT
jgi:hypothetical protein